jgi:hypothetical protein
MASAPSSLARTLAVCVKRETSPGAGTRTSTSEDAAFVVAFVVACVAAFVVASSSSSPDRDAAISTSKRTQSADAARGRTPLDGAFHDKV